MSDEIEIEPTPHTWDFVYDGPVHAVDERQCDLCNAAAAKRCSKSPLQHGRDFASCATCHSAKIAHCANHCGLQAALTQHTVEHVIDEEHRHTFAAAVDALVAHAKTLPPDVRNLYVKAYANEGLPDSPFSVFHVHVVATK
jgi:hypothetical protein